MHITSEPPILYFGTPVVLISTLNEDGSANLAPMSSAFWLGWRCMLGLSAFSKTTENLRRTRQAVLNLPSDKLVAAVDRLALTTGSDPVPPHKAARGYRTVRDKFGIAQLTPVASQTVGAPRVAECPVQMEVVLEGEHGMSAEDTLLRGKAVALEVRVQRVHLAPEILAEGERDRVDPDRWHPLIMSFQKFYGLAPRQLHDSRLATIPERQYRSPDVDRARTVN
jgi:flavin reductase (DIM6/NTAB) family NADH-FMN oxidoreductase RutF